MEQLLKYAKEQTFSANDIERILCGNVHIILYKDLAKVKNINSLLDRPCVILYETKKNYGHWTLLLKIHPDTLELFDSYAYYPDQQLEFVGKEYRNKLTAYPHLSKLIINSPFTNIISNNKPLQKFSKDINTCGRWVAVRALLWEKMRMPLNRFIDIFDKKYGKLTPDDIITLMTILL